MTTMKKMLLTVPVIGACSVAACGGPVELDVEIVDPCNQAAVASVEFLKFTPRGDGIDEGFSTTYGINDSGIEPITVPLASDFSIVATGHNTGADGLPDFRETRAIGVSAEYDLTSAPGAVSIKVPFALVDSFYRTTSLDGEPTCTELAVDRFGATATFLPNSGRVLIVGGAQIIPGTPPEVRYPRGVELYDPATGTFQVVAELRVGGARKGHTATLLDGGRVLIAGGDTIINGTTTALRTAFIIDATDPLSVRIAESGLAMREARTGHRAVRLKDGRVALIGGRELVASAIDPRDHAYLDSVEVYEPTNQLFTLPNDPASNALRMSKRRFGHSATLLESGQDILVAGGMNDQGVVGEVEVITLGETSTVTAQPSAITGVGPIFHSAALAQNGEVLLSGGYNRIEDAEPSGMAPQNPTGSVEMWAFVNGRVARTCSAALNRPRGHHAVTMSGKDAVFVGGRDQTGVPLGVGEVATLTTGGSCFARAPTEVEMDSPRFGHAITKIETSGEILVVGGLQQNMGDVFGRSLKSAEVYSPRRSF
ncbi:MAG: hypothetical protein RMA76_45465 [Deltaproteobacteria bacterium]|jgi:hypothetical protein